MIPGIYQVRGFDLAQMIFVRGRTGWIVFTTLIPLTPADTALLHVEMMGGSAAILARGHALHDEGRCLLATEILNKLVLAEPGSGAAKDLLADVCEQVGYQQKNSGLRNSFLAGAYEIRSGIPKGEAVRSSSPT